MDQLKEILEKLKIHHFWIACVCITLMYIGSYFWISGSVQSDTEDRISDYKSQFSSAQNVLNKQNHPNDQSHEWMDAKIAGLENEVLQAWQKQYSDQVSILKWPEQFAFKSQAEALKPIEAMVPFPPDQPAGDRKASISTLHRQQYRYFIPYLHWA